MFRLTAIALVTVLFLAPFVASAEKTSSQGDSSISFRHIGDSDAYIKPLLVSDSKISLEESYKEIAYKERLPKTVTDKVRFFQTVTDLVGSKVMAQLLSIVTMTSSDPPSHRLPFGTFEIVTSTSRGRRAIVLDKTRTFTLLERLKKVCGNGRPFEDLLNLQEQIAR
jgi:hypothetical protein